MAMKNFLQGLSSKPQPAPPADAGSDLRMRILDEFDKAGIGWIWATDAQGELIYLAEQAMENLGLATGDLLGQPLDEIFELDATTQSQGSGRSLKFQLKAQNKIRDQVMRFTLDNSVGNMRQTWWSLSGYPVLDSEGKFIGYRGNAHDVSVEYERQIRDSKLADFDSLTGLANRHNMDRHIDATLAAFKSANRPSALMMLDLDKFKRVNDTLGHQAGDALLGGVAERLRSIVGERGKIARLGGDEFQVFIPDEDDRGKLGDLADKIIQIVSQPYPLDDGKRAIIGASVGIAVAPFDGAEREDIVRSADLALYAAKNGGRGQFRFYGADLKSEELEREALLDDLRTALEAGQLRLEYQPVVSIASGAVVCLEALMRWEHPVRGEIPPASFIPVAEESDLINNLGEWALRNACETATKWPKSLNVAVNVSAVQFANQGLPTVIANALAHSGLEPHRLELELTESIFVGDSIETEQTFATLKSLGVRLALDDFGTGYSSLSYLQSAPFDKIKVDKSFVEGCTQEDKNSAKIIAAIVGLSSALSMETTVEGVEAFDQLEVVKARGAKLVQGFIYSRPLREEEVLERINSGEFKIVPDGPKKYRADRRTVYRRIGVIHEDYYYNAVMRNLSRNGAGIEGIVGIPVGTEVVLDLGEGQLAVSRVIHSADAVFGVEFENRLTSDGSGGLCTRHRVSPFTIASVGLPDKPGTAGPNDGKRNEATPKFLEVAATKAAN